MQQIERSGATTKDPYRLLVAADASGAEEVRERLCLDHVIERSAAHTDHHVAVVHSECVDDGLPEDLGGDNRLKSIQVLTHALLPVQVPARAIDHQLIILQPILKVVMPVVEWEVVAEGSTWDQKLSHATVIECLAYVIGSKLAKCVEQAGVACIYVYTCT